MAKILLVGSDDRKRAEHRARLTFHDVFITDVNKGMAAIEHLARSKFDLLVTSELYGDSMDVVGLSHDVRRFLKGMRQPLIPIVLLTSERIGSGMHAHFNMVLTTPLQESDVWRILNRIGIGR